MSSPILPRIFGSEDHEPDPATLDLLERGVADADLAAPPVVLPDFHHKHHMEIPSSISVATRETIRPTLTSSAVNCGMALLTIDAERPPTATIESFFRQVRDRYPDPPGYRPVLTTREVLGCALDGADYAVEHWGLDPDSLPRIEEGGRLDPEPYGGRERARHELPWLITQLARLKFGSIGPSTHFVELQEVEEVFDQDAAGALGVHTGQLTLQYHNGGGVLTSLLGALFGKRKAESRALRLVMSVQKPLYHLASAHSLDELRLRLALYFNGGCPPIAADSAEGQRLLLANVLAMNYGFAYRQATYAGLRAVARSVFGGRTKLVVDSPHNAIYKEEVDGQPAYVHRHNTSRAYPASKVAGHPVFGRTGTPVLLPGTNRTSSYLCVPCEGASASLYSACHGTGSIIDDFQRRGLSASDPNHRATLRFGYGSPEPLLVPHLDDRGVNEAIGILQRHDILRPVARMRPLAVLN